MVDGCVFVVVKENSSQSVHIFTLFSSVISLKSQRAAVRLSPPVVYSSITDRPGRASSQHANFRTQMCVKLKLWPCRTNFSLKQSLLCLFSQRRRWRQERNVLGHPATVHVSVACLASGQRVLSWQDHSEVSGLLASPGSGNREPAVRRTGKNKAYRTKKNVKSTACQCCKAALARLLSLSPIVLVLRLRLLLLPCSSALLTK